VTGKPAPVAATRTATSGAPTIKGVDKVLIYLAMVAGLVGVGSTAYLWWFLLKPAIENFQS
jgi:hypothetical protein